MVLSFSKGRCGDHTVLVQIRKLLALELALDVRFNVRWVASELNPSDLGSRSPDPTLKSVVAVRDQWPLRWCGVHAPDAARERWSSRIRPESTGLQGCSEQRAEADRCEGRACAALQEGDALRDGEVREDAHEGDPRSKVGVLVVIIVVLVVVLYEY